MIIIRSWLQDYIHLSHLSDQDLSDTLTHLGLEVEEYHTVPAIDPLVVVGVVLSIKKHPNAEKLSVAEVLVTKKLVPESHSVDGDDVVTIVCGASNLRVEMKVAVALVGSKLPNGHMIKSTKIRGELSQGMICSLDELGLTSEAQAGIWPLESDWQVGKELEHYVAHRDTILTLNITPNRSDCLGYIGIARDLGAKFNQPYQTYDNNRSDQSVFVSEGEANDHGQPYTATDQLATVTVDATGDQPSNDGSKEPKSDEICQRFMLLYVEGVPGDVTSPYWLQRRLFLSGIRPKSLMIDITNYLMLEWSQPVHAYDAHKVQNLCSSYTNTGKVSFEVQTAKNQTLIETLDGQKVVLCDSDIMISSNNVPLGIAGVMGGKTTEVTGDSESYFLEFADFCPSSIRKTAKKLKMNTDASYRFERGIDMATIATVVDRCANLVHECTKRLGLDIKVLKPLDYYGLLGTYTSPCVAMRVDRASKVLGLHLTIEECQSILGRLGCHIVDQKGSRFLVSIPSHRHDLKREVDLIEEIGRIKGYDQISGSLPPVVFTYRDQNLVTADTLPEKITNAQEHPFCLFVTESKEILAHLGLTEVILYPFLAPKDFEQLRLKEEHPLYSDLEVTNPLSHHNLLQVCQGPAMLKNVVYNRSRLNKKTKIFQVGRGYFLPRRDESISRAYQPLSDFLGQSHIFAFREQNNGTNQSIREINFLTMVFDISQDDVNGQQQAEASTFFYLKTCLENFLACFNHQQLLSYQSLSDQGELLPFLNPNQSAKISLNRQMIGYLGVLHPEVACHLGLGLSQ
ncbi:MAG: phenylalanine--tRNA ligase subunit beta, partial [Proteobacteria bacterium]|nr:phenylalanine--tRNA ligase subunit beta [Pseudomonadota bacterium]